MGRLLAIDYGQKRCGIAVSDPQQIIATGLETVPTAGIAEWLNEYTKRESVSTIIIGMPMQTTGEPSENAARVKTFVARLHKLFPAVAIEYADERFTSVLAHRTMLDTGIGKKARQDKALVDKISATIILQTYMEAKRNS